MIEQRIASRGHAVVITAEGAGQELITDAQQATDASGNKLHADIGLFLKERITSHFKEKKIELNLKYIDPSYIIRSVPAAPEDRIFCLNLGRHAVHAGMAGKTGMVVARWHQSFVHLPMALCRGIHRPARPHGGLMSAPHPASCSSRDRSASFCRTSGNERRRATIGGNDSPASSREFGIRQGFARIPPGNSGR
jgi:6-phosphofructokinase 1